MRKQLQAETLDHPVYNYLAGLRSEHSKRTMRSALKTLAGLILEKETYEVILDELLTIPWDKFDRAKTEILVSKGIDRGYSPSQVNKVLVALRGVLERAYDMGWIQFEDLYQIKKVKSVRQDRGKAGRLLSTSELLAISSTCKADLNILAGARDNAIFAIGYTLGLRISEISALEMAHYDPETGDIQILESKGGKSRQVRVANNAKDALDHWISLRGDHKGRIFLPVFKSGKLKTWNSPKLSTTAISQMIQKRQKEAGIKAFTAHDLRRTMITNSLRQGSNIRSIQRLVGHSSVETTASYDRSDIEEALREGTKLHYPS